MDFKAISTTDIRELLTFFQAVTAIFATIYYNKYKATNLKYIVLLLWYIAINEYVGKYYTLYTGCYNQGFYNVKQIVEITFYIKLYINTLKNVKSKNLLVCLLICYYLSIISSCFRASFIAEYFVNNYLLGASFIVIGIIMYFSEILKSDDIILINKKLLFWISVGLLIYYVPTIPFKVVTVYYQNSPTLPYIFNISYALVFLLNSLFISGFIWSSKQQTD